MEKYIVDRFEENIVVLESEKGGTIDVEASLLPEVKAGDVLVKNGDVYTVDKEETEKRKSVISEKLKKLLEKH